MALKRVFAYYTEEKEQQAAEALLQSAQITESFAVGDIDENDIEELRSAGVIVREPAKASAAGMEAGGGAIVLEHAPFSFGLDGGPAAAFDDVLPAEVDWYVVHLRGPLFEPYRRELASLGVELTQALLDDAYKARLTSQQVADVSALSYVANVRWIGPEQSKPQVAALAVGGGDAAHPAGERLPFDVRLHDPADREKIVQWLNDRQAPIVGSSARKIRISVAAADPMLQDLAVLPEVDAIAQFVPPDLYNDRARRLLGVDGLAASPSLPILAQDGSGQIVAVADTGIDDQHPDFQGRIVGKVGRGRQNDTSDPHGHGTHVAGSVLGDGTASGGKIKGTAPQAKLFFQSLLDEDGKLGGLPVDLNDLFKEAYDAGARIHNDSWGADLGSIYTMNSEEVDEFIHDHPDMLIVIAAGNAGKAASPRKSAKGFVDWLSIGSPASCKNALTVGASRSDRTDGALSAKTWGEGWPNNYPDPPIAQEKISGDPQSLAAFSSRGPTDDRRIKPDVVAPGTDIASTRSSLASKFWGPHPNDKYAFDGGTSMATPLVSGCAALVRQYYVDTRKIEPSAALLKATLVNSTTWLTGADATAPSLGTPNYHQGHGRVNMQIAIPNPTQPGLSLQFVDSWKTQGAALSSTGDDPRRYQFILPKNVPELRICLAYTDAPARGLQNNVSLIVSHIGSGKKWQGNEQLADALTLPDPDNNVEVVRIGHPPAGTFLIQVFVVNMLKPPQDFALVVTGINVPALTRI